MGKMDKEIERKAQIAKTKRNFKAYYDKYDAQEKQLIELAAQCKKEKRMFDYRQTVETLKYISNGKRTMGKYLYQIELVEILADEAQMGKDFVKLMGEVGQETASIYKNIDVKKTKQITENTRKIANQQATFNDYLQSIAQMQDDTMEDFDAELDKELLDRIDALAGVNKTKNTESKKKTKEASTEVNDELDQMEKEFFSKFE
ncbi:MAG: hypothetical protein E7176_06510 [Erysipelotrichaceae bacterium]|nr:hypothetical protein [Erysipelotrichaceae bacterium]